MKKITGLLLVSFFAGAITLGGYKLFFEGSDYKIISENPNAQVFTTNYTPTSAKGAGINEVDFTIAAENTVNAVVHVKNVTEGSGRSGSITRFFYGFDPEERPQIGTGSGVIISPDGFIVTNNHVVAKANQLRVTLNNNKSYDAKLVGADPTSDIALIKIEAEDKLPYLAFGDSDNAKIGEWVLAVGNPFNLTSTVTAGIVSAKARDLGRRQSFIQTDAAVNPGNSGGALVNTNGDLIGINTAITSQTGSYVGYSFAVPSNIAKKVIDDLLEYGNVQQGILGVSALQINSRQAIEQGIDEIDGVYISGVEEGSGADRGGLQKGDVIKRIDNIRVRKFADLTGYISSKRPGDKVDVLVDRSGKSRTFPVTLKKRQSLVLPVMNITVKNLSENDKKAFKIKKGVKIVGVPERYRDYDMEGKILLSVDDNDIGDIQEARNQFEKISRYGRTAITMLNRDGERERLIFQ
ncbi:MAG: trypsin-like peptidase domain-containing protein [Bacteroidota bacterium]